MIPAAGEGPVVVDPPMQLIGNFLQKQSAPEAEMSLDLDPEMEDLGRVAQGEWPGVRA
jgi:hypothetical protein